MGGAPAGPPLEPLTPGGEAGSVRGLGCNETPLRPAATSECEEPGRAKLLPEPRAPPSATQHPRSVIRTPGAKAGELGCKRGPGPP